LNALRRVAATDGPEPGQHNFFIDPVRRVWDDAMATSWNRDPVWFHGDVASGSLSAVLDFGSSGVGDPACDIDQILTEFAQAR
jgi:aminoglycoside phosphotransferase (APT) family kinase protein